MSKVSVGSLLHLEQETLRARPGQKRDESVFCKNKTGYGEDEKKRGKERALKSKDESRVF